MSKTEVSGKQLKDGSVQRVDLDVATSGQSVIAKVVAGDNISISSTGADTGTGDVTINLGGTIAADITSLDTRVTAVESDVSAIQSAAAPNLSDLGEVSITSPSSGQVLKYNGTGWANAADSSFSGDYNDLSNKPTLVSALDDLSDVAITSPSSDQVLKYNGTAWVNSAAPAAGATDLDGLTDVAITSAAKGQFIVHNGTSFVNSNTIEASGAAVKPLIVKGAASQTANLFEIQNSSGTVLFSVDNTGSIRIKDTSAGANYTFIGMPGGSQYNFGAGANVGTGTYCCFVGASAGQRYASGTGNVSLGTQALWGQSGANGSYNTAVGWQPGLNMTSGSYSTFVGAQAGASNTTANSNVCIGYQSGYNFTTGGNNVSIGYGAGASTGNGTITGTTSLGHLAQCSGTDALAIGRAASAAANSMDIRFGGASRITGDSSGNIAVANTLHAARYTETVANAFNTSLAPSSGTLTVDTSLGNAVLGALNASVTTWAFTNVPTDNSKVTTVSAIVAGNTSYTYGSACSVNGSAVATGVQWFGGTAPASSSSTDVLTFVIVKDSAGTIRVLGSGQTIDSVVGSASAGIDGAGSANYLSKWTDANTIANSAIYESAGNVGIGTASPSSKLSVVQTAASLSNGVYTALIDSTAHNSNLSTAGALKVSTNTVANALVVNGSGRIGIAAAPSAWHSTATSIVDHGGNYGFMNLNGANYFTQNSYWNAAQQWVKKAAGYSTLYYMGGTSTAEHAWYTDATTGSADGSVTWTERMKIDSNGRVCIAGASPAGDSVIHTNLAGPRCVRTETSATSLTTHYAFKNGNGDVGFINTNGSSTSFQTTSDYRLKENIVDLPNALARVSDLKPRRFNFKVDPSVTVDGFIAHELQEVLPEAVSGDKDAVKEDGSIMPQSVDYSKLTPLLAAALKELSAKVDALQAEKEALEARLAALENN